MRLVGLFRSSSAEPVHDGGRKGRERCRQMRQKEPKTWSRRATILICAREDRRIDRILLWMLSLKSSITSG